MLSNILVQRLLPTAAADLQHFKFHWIKKGWFIMTTMTTSQIICNLVLVGIAVYFMASASTFVIDEYFARVELSRSNIFIGIALGILTIAGVYLLLDNAYLTLNHSNITQMTHELSHVFSALTTRVIAYINAYLPVWLQL